MFITLETLVVVLVYIQFANKTHQLKSVQKL